MRRRNLAFALVTAWAGLGSACGDEGRRALPVCSDDQPCEEGICYLGQCLDPQGDEDDDGLINAVEIGLGTDPFNADTDGDGVPDGEEVGDPQQALDTDGDRALDALEHSVEDADGDCIADQFDPVDDPFEDLRAEACDVEGVCGEQVESLRPECTPPTTVGGEVTWTCDYGLVEGYAADGAERCDGLDDDCDGLVDEDFPEVGTPCGAADPGACPTGVFRCAEDGSGPVCEASGDLEEVCNGVDDDCDGLTDEDLVGEPTACGEGACAAAGETACEGGVMVDTCAPKTPAAGDASCNAIDDDCDGSTDEDFAAVATTCGEGACAATGSTSCEGGAVVDTCTPGAGAADDATCDGLDDDCDGSTDEDFVSESTVCGEGACSGSGVTLCEDGVATDTCEAGGAPVDASCDGVDDDCDGSTDEDFAPVATTCGVGACKAAGATTCVGGGVVDSCTPALAAASDATCDGVDEDCDGSTDEDFAPAATTCGAGACASSGSTSCVGGEVDDSCTPGVPAADDATCDAVDDDCDGSTDEDFAETSTCGTGACQTTGAVGCDGGVEIDTCTPLAPDCAGRACGPDGCGGSCGTCPAGEACDDEVGLCACAPQCDGKTCGPDGCGGSCGTCPAPAEACLEAFCTAGGTCDEAIAADACLVDGACRTIGEANPDAPCEVCEPKASQEAWTQKPDWSTCDDANDATVGDWCYGSVCGGFYWDREPLLGPDPEVYTKGSSALGGGAQGVFEAANGQTLMVAHYAGSLNPDLTTLSFPGGRYAVSRRVILTFNELWERVDGLWTDLEEAGSLRAAWPDGGEFPSQFEAVAEHTPLLLGGESQVMAAGRAIVVESLALERCSRGTFCLGGACTWTCSGQPLGEGLSNEWPEAVAFFGDEPVVGANFGSETSPGFIDVLRFDEAQGLWVYDLGLAVPGNGRALRALAATGGGSLITSPDPWLVGAGTRGLLYVSDLTTVWEIAVPGFSKQGETDFAAVTTFKGRVFVVGRHVTLKQPTFVLAHAPIGAGLADPATWSVHTLLVEEPGAAVSMSALGADATQLFALGGAIPSDGTSRRAVWRWAEPPGQAVFFETFDLDTFPADGWQVVDQCVDSASSWQIIHDGVSNRVAELGHCTDFTGGDSSLPKLGTMLIHEAATLGDGVARVRVRGSSMGAWGLAYGLQDPQTYYRFSVNAELGLARLVRATDGEFVGLASTDFSPRMGEWQEIEVRREGDLHVLSVDGEVVLEAQDGTLPAGLVAPYAWQMEGLYLDDLALYPF